MKLRFVFSFILISLLFLFLPQTIHASTIISNTFDSSSGLTLEGATINSGSLELSDDGVSLDENFDSYSDGTVPTNWSRDTSDWQISSQAYHYLTNAYDNATTIWDGGSLKNATVSADLTALGGEQFAGIIFRWQDASNFYYAYFSSLYDNITLSKYVSGSTSNVCTTSETLDVSTAYSLAINYVGTHIEVYLDGVKKLDCYDSSISSAGKIGFWRNGAGMIADNLLVSSKTYFGGSATSDTQSFSSNITSASLSMSASNSSLVDVYVSNDGGTSWSEVTDGNTVYFDSTGTSFKYKIFLQQASTNPTVDNVSFTINEGSKDTVNETVSTGVSRLHYQTTGNAVINNSVDPSNLSLYTSLSDTKMVQQAAIVPYDGKTVIYYGDSDNHTVDAYDLTNKTELWSIGVNGYIEGTPYVDSTNSVVYAGSYPDKFYALDQSDGSTLWSYTANDAISGSPIDIKDGVAYFADYGYGGTTTLYAVNISTHTLSWSYPVSGTYYMSFSVDHNHDRIYVSYSDTVVSLKSSDGSLLWKNPLGNGYITKQPTIANQYLVVGEDQAIAVLNKLTGETVWTQTFASAEDGVGASPVVSQNTIYYPTKNDATVYAKSLNDGSPVWSTSIPGGVGTFSTPVLTSDGYLYISYNAGVRAFDTSDGSIVWTSSQSAWNENVVSIGEGYLAFTDPASTGTLYVYQLSKETYTSNNGLVFERDDRTINSITANSTKSQNFSCTSSLLTVNNAGTINISFGSLSSGTVKPNSMIINPIATGEAYICHPSASSISFTYNFGTLSFNNILRDGAFLPFSSWSANGSLVTITDSFSSHLYKVTTLTGSSPPICKADPPPYYYVPNIYKFVKVSPTQVTLFWTKSDSPYTDYLVFYGREEDKKEYATRTYTKNEQITISELNPNTTYYFSVAAINDCAPGSFSLSAIYNPKSFNNQIGEKISSFDGQVLGKQDTTTSSNQMTSQESSNSNNTQNFDHKQEGQNTGLWSTFVNYIKSLKSLVYHLFSR